MPSSSTTAPPVAVELSTAANTAAVIVTYHPDASFPEHLERIARQVGRVFVVDNASNRDALAMLQTLADKSDSVVLIENEENLGVATAFNQGVRASRESGYAWVLTFDQDSWVDERLLTALATVVSEHPQPTSIGIVGVNYWHAVTGEKAYEPRSGEGQWIEVDAVITSGSLMSTAIFDEIGCFREELFIDCVDSDYCLRLLLRGYKVLMATEPLLKHKLGNQEKHRLLWKRPSCTHYTAIRHYYLMRNRLSMISRYCRSHPAWAFRELREICVVLLLLTLYERQRLTKFRAVVLGAWHALRRRAGKLRQPNL